MKYFKFILPIALFLFSCSTEPLDDLKIEQRIETTTPIVVAPVCPDDGFFGGVEFRLTANEDGRLFIEGYLPKNSSVNGYFCVLNGEYIYPPYENYVGYCYFYLDLKKGDRFKAYFNLTRTPTIGGELWFGDWRTHFNQLETPTIHRVYDKCNYQQTTYSHYN